LKYPKILEYLELLAKRCGIQKFAESSAGPSEFTLGQQTHGDLKFLEDEDWGLEMQDLEIMKLGPPLESFGRIKYDMSRICEVPPIGQFIRAWMKLGEPGKDALTFQ